MGADIDDLSLQLERAVVSLDRVAVRELLADCLAVSGAEGGVAFAGLVFSAALRRIGDQWQEGTLALSQVFMSARVCEQTLLELLPPSEQPHGQARIAIAALIDRHALGKSIVSSVLRASGHALADYGVGLSVEELVSRTLQERPRVLLVSTLILPSALKIREVCERLAARGSETRVVVGGAPFVLAPDLWRVVGADDVGYHAGDAPAIVERLLAPEALLLENAV